ncbi:MAG: glycosyltransferase [Myxacorys californica WJT36-NPBG1]|jgi:glycosyltransferase involved in cell wall biosynthesis|nr:glycosyltransferase [Myxacorys californica WJT36-NPBG1]
MARIALIAGTYAPDRCGVAHYTAHLRTVLAQRGIETFVLTTHAVAGNEPTILGAVEDWNVSNLISLTQAIHRTKADILHIQHAAGTYGFDRSIFLLPLLLKQTGWNRPIVTTIHEYGWWEWQPKWISQPLLERIKDWGQQRYWWDREDGFLLTRSNAIITTNEQATQTIDRRLPLLMHKVHQIPIGANIEVASSGSSGVAPGANRGVARKMLLQTCGWSQDSVVLAFFGFLHPVKGLETLLQAFKAVVQKQPQARLILIGGVESLALRGEEAQQYWQKLEAEIASLNLTSYVHMTGYLDSRTASHYLTGSDIGVLPFHHGVTLKSGSLLALMAHGLPIVATHSNDSELSTLVEQVAPRQVDDLAIALTQLIANPTRANDLAQQGRHFSHNFTWDSIADAHLEIYRSVSPAISTNMREEIAIYG